MQQRPLYAFTLKIRTRNQMHLALYVIFFLSGIAGLGYEIVWTRMFAIGLGHEMPSMLAVVAAFFGGLTIGAWALDGIVSQSRVPGRWYAFLEILISAWAITSIFLIPEINRLTASLIGVEPPPIRQWLFAMVIPFVGLFPATAAMGATFPAMERLLSRLRRSGRTIAGLYGVNTAGAVAGTLLTTFVVVPAFGFRMTLVTLAAINVVCAVATVFGPARGERLRPSVLEEFPDRPSSFRLGVTIFGTGLLGIGYEVLCVRVMGQVLENTVYSFASALCAYLFATSLGALFYQRFLKRSPFTPLLIWLLQLLALSCLLGVILIQYSSTIYEFCRAQFGGGFAGSIAAEMVLALLVFVLPTFFMGATFSHLAQAARREGGGIGRSFALNTLGASLAPVLFGVVLLPLLGAKWSMILVAVGYLPLIPLRQVKVLQLVPIAIASLLILQTPPNLVLVKAPPRARIIDYREGIMASVAVIEHEQGWRQLKVNNRFNMGSTAGTFAEKRMAHIPLLLHPNPATALFLGVGTGVTARAAATHSALAVKGVELIPEVIEALPYFEPLHHSGRRQQTLIYTVADARRYVRATEERYDVIVADLFHAARDGAGALYTKEHFEAVRRRLNEGGSFCQWLSLHQLDIGIVRVITRTFIDVFPDSRAYIAHFNADTPLLGLIGTTRPPTYTSDWYKHRVTDRRLAVVLRRVGLTNELELFGCLLADKDDLAEFAGNSRINTDDHPLVMFLAPHFAYRKDEPRYGRLEAILTACKPAVEEIISAHELAGDQTFVNRLKSYLAARNLFLRGLILLQKRQQEEAILTFLDSARTSGEFRTAVAMIRKIAYDLRNVDPATSRKILKSLKQIYQ
jgi:spermidine synthase